MHFTAGSLVLGDGGVCVVGNLSYYKKDLMEKLQHSEPLSSIMHASYCRLCLHTCKEYTSVIYS